jgi:hypothetical protein
MSTASACPQIPTIQPEAGLLDIDMPEINGYEVARPVRSIIAHNAPFGQKLTCGPSRCMRRTGTPVIPGPPEGIPAEERSFGFSYARSDRGGRAIWP